MTKSILLRIDGEVERPMQLRFEDFQSIAPRHQIADVSRIDPKRKGSGVHLAAVMELVGVKSSARYLGLHSSLDDFHASIPIEPVQKRGLFIYQLDEQPLDTKQGGPIRFYIPDFAECHTEEIDECANVKFVDYVEFSNERGFDNRPEDDEQHEALHRGGD